MAKLKRGRGMRRQAAAKQQIRVGEHGPQPLVGSHRFMLMFEVIQKYKVWKDQRAISKSNTAYIAIAITGKPKLLRLDLNLNLRENKYDLSL
jgi:hypothetical protein